MRKIKVVFTGYYGFDNFGDDLFGVACGHALEKVSCHHVPLVLSPPVDGGTIGYRGKYIVPSFLRAAYKSKKFVGKLLRAAYMAYCCLKYDEIVLAGGSVISSGSSMRMRALQMFFAKRGICRLSAIGVSVGPFSNSDDREKAKSFIGSLTFLTVRDIASVAECKSLGVSIEPLLFNDLAGCAPLPSPRNKDVSSKTLGVSVCNYESIIKSNTQREEKRNAAIFKGILDFAVKHSFSVNILVLNRDNVVGDNHVSQRLYELLTENGVRVKLINYAGPTATMNAIANCSLFFSVRLHGAIISYLLGVPFVLVEYHRKCKNFLDHIGYCKKLRVTSDLEESKHVVHCLEHTLKRKSTGALAPSEYIDKSWKVFSESPWARSSSQNMFRQHVD